MEQLVINLQNLNVWFAVAFITPAILVNIHYFIDAFTDQDFGTPLQIPVLYAGYGLLALVISMFFSIVLFVIVTLSMIYLLAIDNTLTIDTFFDIIRDAGTIGAYAGYGLSILYVFVWHLRNAKQSKVK